MWSNRKAVPCTVVGVARLYSGEHAYVRGHEDWIRTDDGVPRAGCCSTGMNTIVAGLS